MQLLHGRRLAVSGIIRSAFSRPPITRICQLRSSSTASPRKAPWLDSDQQHGENVFPDSLRDTLDAHRDSNRTSVIHKVVLGTGIRSALDLSHGREEEQQSKSSPVYSSVKATRHIDTGSSSRGTAEQDYVAKVNQLTRLWAPTPILPTTSRYPWLAYLVEAAEDSTNDLGVERLTKEIAAFDAYMCPKKEESSASSMAIDMIRQELKMANKDLSVDVVGSRSSGLATPLSDIDMNLTPSKYSPTTRRLSVPLLASLFQSLRRRTQSSSSMSARSVEFQEFRKRALVPLICGKHLPTHLEFQIQHSTDAYLSLQHTKALIAEYPTLPGLFRMLKQMLVMRGLWAGRGSGMTAYPLTIMIAATLRLCEGRHDRRAAGSHLLAFLDMYSEIDFYTTGISMSPVRRVRKVDPSKSELSMAVAHTELSMVVSPSDNTSGWQPTLNKNRPWLMSLEDPANAYNDLGKSIVLIKDIQATFISIRPRLHEALQAWEEQDGDDDKVPLLACCVEGDYSIFESERTDLRTAFKQNEPLQ